MTVNPEQSMLPSEKENTSQDTTQIGSISSTNASSDKEADTLSLPKANQAPTYKSDDNDSEDKPLSWQQWWRAYGATLYVLGSVVHIVASIVTVVLFFISP